MRSTRGQTIVFIGPLLPYEGIPHAGGNYLLRLHERLAEDASVISFTADDLSSLRATQRPHSQDDATAAPSGGLAERLLSSARSHARLAVRSTLALAKKIDPTLPEPSFALRLMTSSRVRAAIRSADVVDIHWAEYIRLASFVRRINPGTRIVCTFYDVNSQRYGRYHDAAEGVLDRAHLGAVSAIARQSERRALAAADVAVVLSDKDAMLLPTGKPRSQVVVVRQPLGLSRVLPRSPSRARRDVLFVGSMSRFENDDAMTWFIEVMWPAVIDQCPDAHLTIAGAGPSEHLQRLTTGRTDITVTGYVDDLAPLYARAWACVVPLRFGAGVKLKAIDAIAAGVPTIVTSVGAEGIGGPEVFAGVADTADAFARRVVWALERPEEARIHAESTQKWALETYGLDRFREAVRKIYLQATV